MNASPVTTGVQRLLLERELAETPEDQWEGSGLILIRCIGSQGFHQTWNSPQNYQCVRGHLGNVHLH